MTTHDTNVMGPHKAFADRLRLALDLSDVSGSYKQIGKRLGCSAAFVSHMLNGHKLPGMETAMSIAGVTGVNIEWLVMGRGPMKPGDPNPDYISLENLSEQSKETIKAVLEALRKQQ